jgi:hypothetical protein
MNSETKESTIVGDILQLNTTLQPKIAFSHESPLNFMRFYEALLAESVR